MQSRLEVEPEYCTNHSRHSTQRKGNVFVASHRNPISQVGFRRLQGGREEGVLSVTTGWSVKAGCKFFFFFCFARLKGDMTPSLSLAPGTPLPLQSPTTSVLSL